MSYSRAAAICLAAVLLLLLAANLGVRGEKKKVDGQVSCYNCSSWDNTTACLEESDAVVQECNMSLEVGALKAHCLSEYIHECQSSVLHSARDTDAYGGNVMKRWGKFGCVFLDPETEHLKKYLPCYWKRKRGGKDVLVEYSGFQVIGRSMITRTCYCKGDKCNKLGDENCIEKCGPDCAQQSRDECGDEMNNGETEAEDKDAPKECKCPGIDDKPEPPKKADEKNAPPKSERVDWSKNCGISSDLMKVKMADKKNQYKTTYRHQGLGGRYIDKVREKPSPDDDGAAGVGPAAWLVAGAVGVVWAERRDG